MISFAYDDHGTLTEINGTPDELRTFAYFLEGRATVCRMVAHDGPGHVRNDHSGVRIYCKAPRGTEKEAQTR